MFKKVIGQDQNEAARQAQTPSESSSAAESSASRSSQSRPSPAVTRNVLSSDVEIKGAVKFSDDLVVDGKIEGEINSAGNLTIGENARIKAEVKTGTIVVYGKVHGNLTATDRVELKASAEIVGDIKAKTLSIEAGAIFVGKSTVGSPAQAAAQSSSSSQPAKNTSAPQQSSAPSQQPKQGELSDSSPQS